MEDTYYDDNPDDGWLDAEYESRFETYEDYEPNPYDGTYSEE